MAPKSPRTPRASPRARSTPKKTPKAATPSPKASPKASPKSPAGKATEAVCSPSTALLFELGPKVLFALGLLIVPREVYVSYDSTGGAKLAAMSKDDMAHIAFVMQGYGLALLMWGAALYAVYKSESPRAAHNACLACAAFHAMHIPYTVLYSVPRLGAIGLPESVAYTNLAIWSSQLVVHVLALNGAYALQRGPRYSDYLDVPAMLWAVRCGIALSLFYGLLFVIMSDNVVDLFGLTKDGKPQFTPTVMKHLVPLIPGIGWTYLGHAFTLTAAAVSYDRHTVYLQCFFMVVYYAMAFAANCVEKTAYYKLGFATDGILFTLLMCAGIAFLSILGIGSADVASRSPTHDKKHFA